MSVNPYPESRESSPVRRPNTRTSCDLCKRMKIKCERQGETCLHCIDRGSKCETTLVERKKRQVKRVDPGSISEMDRRIQRLESVIAASGLNPQLSMESPGDTAETPPSDTTHVADRLSTLRVDEEGGSSFLGSSSGFSLFSPQGLQWISERTGSYELPQTIRVMSKLVEGTKTLGEISIWSPMPDSSREPLPPKPIADRWIQCYFETFNRMLPLYDRAIFDRYYAQQYTSNPPTGSPWYASINVVLCIGGLISEAHSHPRAEGPMDNSQDFHNSQYSKYFRNAASCFLDLTFKESSLMAVQATCGMAFLQQMNLKPHQSYVLASASCRMAYSIGLHRKLDESDVSESEINSRNNVFWIVYMMDKMLALRLGRPSIINDSDIGIDLPRDPRTLSDCPDDWQLYDSFLTQVQLAIIESRIYTELFSSRAHKKSALERLRSVGQLDKDLQEWRLSIPIEVRPDEHIRSQPDKLPPVLLMHFRYFNCVSTIHRVSVHHRGTWTNDELDQSSATIHSPQINPRVYASQSICLSAARSTIRILQFVDTIEDIRLDNFIWTEMYYPISAFLLLFANVLYNPEDPSATSDLQLMDLVLSVMTAMVGHTGPFDAKVALRLFQELRNVGEKFIERKNPRQARKTKRGYDSDLPKGEAPSISAVASQTGPQLQANLGSQYMPQPYMSQQPPHTNVAQFGQEPLGQFGDSAYIPDNSQQMPLDDVGFPTLGLDAFMFSENFEWDLANLWNQEYNVAV